MIDALALNEAVLRIGFFVGIFALMASWEALAPMRQRGISRGLRWSNNLALVALDSVIVRLVFPVTAVNFAALAAEREWGLINLLGLPFWPALIVSLLLLDLIIYLQHRLFHTVPLLWRLHRVHHADTEFDVTTALRFHPLEMLVSMGLKLAAIAALGAPAQAVLVFEVVLNGAAMFNHANVALPPKVERMLRLVFVTPDMHRIHHSTRTEEMNRNFGFNLAWWDRLLGSYCPRPQQDPRAMPIGLDQFRTQRDLWLDWMLLQPLRDKP
ncbi:MAG: sterol desaturase family protein [Sphingomonas sp.]|jgi:sterol desaturase/sphingolipid hydroxylase (fatty acid hydroxylase superfamily)